MMIDDDDDDDDDDCTYICCMLYIVGRSCTTRLYLCNDVAQVRQLQSIHLYSPFTRVVQLIVHTEFIHQTVHGTRVLTPGPHRTRQRRPGPVCGRPSASRPVPFCQNRLRAALEAVLTGRNGPGRKQDRNSADGWVEDRASAVSEAADSPSPREFTALLFLRRPIARGYHTTWSASRHPWLHPLRRPPLRHKLTQLIVRWRGGGGWSPQGHRLERQVEVCEIWGSAGCSDRLLGRTLKVRSAESRDWPIVSAGAVLGWGSSDAELNEFRMWAEWLPTLCAASFEGRRFT